ncbi:MAG: PAS domain-containing protein, partial [Erysipelotrichaceae bacterium]
DPPFSKIDLISCRNLLIYMGSELQKRVIPLFHYALNPNGILFLGTSETLGENSGLYNVLDSKARIYIKKEYLSQNPSIGLFLPPLTPRFPIQTEKRNLVAKLSLRELTEQGIIQHVNMAGIMVNRDGDIMYLQGHTGMYLEPAQGETGVNNILKMARDGLKHILTANLHKSDRSKSIINSQGLRIKTNGHFTTVNLTIKPISISTVSSSEPLFLVILEEVPNLSMDDQEKILDDDARIIKLKNELRAKEEYLQTANEELETTNEELKSSNEEMQSINEELQSTNEELETSKEELQSVNEELATVNTELQNKVNDLSRTNNDMSNLLAGTGIVTIFVDLSLNILRFTPTAVKIVNLIMSDIGRPLGHVVSNLINYNTLLEDSQSVLDTLIPKELEVTTTEGKRFSMRIMPYRTAENVIEGVVMTFLDISALKKSSLLPKDTEVYLNQLFDNTSNPMSINQLVFNKENKALDFAFIRVNTAFERMLGISNSQLVGQLASKVLSKEAITEQLELYEQSRLISKPVSSNNDSLVTKKDVEIRVFQIGINRFICVVKAVGQEESKLEVPLQYGKKSGE